MEYKHYHDSGLMPVHPGNEKAKVKFSFWPTFWLKKFMDWSHSGYYGKDNVRFVN